MNKSGCSASIGVKVTKRPLIKSIWDTLCTDKDGNEKWRSHDENVVTDEGLIALLDIMFMGGTQITSWFVGLTVNGDSATAASTYAVPIVEECTDVKNAKRPVYTGTQTLKQISNVESKAVFTMNGSEDLLGGILLGGGSAADTLGDTAGGGKLYASIDFSDGVHAVVENDIVSISITLTSTDVS